MSLNFKFEQQQKNVASDYTDIKIVSMSIDLELYSHTASNFEENLQISLICVYSEFEYYLCESIFFFDKNIFTYDYVDLIRPPLDYVRLNLILYGHCPSDTLLG